MSYETIEQMIRATKLWDGEQRKTHAFELTDEVFSISAAQRRSLELLGPVLREVLAGSSRILAIALDDALSRLPAWRSIRRIAELEISKTQAAMQKSMPGKAPGIVKVDLIEAEDGSLMIAEIDAMNRRAMGYASLFARIRKMLAPNAEAPPGIGRSLRRMLDKQGTQELVFIYSERERFYLPEFRILERELLEFGIALHILSETQVKGVESSPFTLITDRNRLVDPLLINIPQFFVNRTMEDRIAQAYTQGEVRTLMSVKPFLGSKGLLALISNANHDEDLEAILRSQIRRESLEGVRSHIPETRFLNGPQAPPGTLLKEMVSAGTKGVIFPDDPEYSRIILDKRRRGDYIAQQIVQGKQRTLRRLTCPDAVLEEPRYTRLVAYYMHGELAEVVVTATAHPLVHGGSAAIHMGVVYTS